MTSTDQRPITHTYECTVGFETDKPISQEIARELWQAAEHFGTVGACRYERRIRGRWAAATVSQAALSAQSEVAYVLNAFDILPRYTKIHCEEVQ